MRILVATDNLSDQINGVAVTFANLRDQCEAHGHTMDFICPSDFSYMSVPWYKEIKLALPIGFSAEGYDRVHIATEGPVGLAAKIYCDRRGISYTSSYHTNFSAYLAQYGIPRFLTNAYIKWFHAKSKKVLVPTSSVMKELNWPHTVEWTRGAMWYDIPRESGGYVLYVGRVSSEKNLDALCCLNENIIIVGDGPDRARLEKKYTHVKFVGYKSGPELFSYYRNADVFAFPSRTDTFGIVLIESLSAGTPVAAYPVTGPIDILTQEVNGYMDEDLSAAISRCRSLNRDIVYKSSLRWTWKTCWDIFEEQL